MISFTSSSRRRMSVLALLLLTFCAGCGGAGELSGKVSYKGKNLKGGSVTFVSKDSGISYPCTIADDGSYTLNTIPAGIYKVCVDTEYLKGDSASSATITAPNMRSGAPGKKPQDGGNEDKAYKNLPADAAAHSGYNPGPAASAVKKANLEKYVQIPSDFRKPETTRLEYTVAGGRTVYNVEMN